MKIYDVTLPLSRRLLPWPGDPSFELLPVASLEAGDEAAVSALRLGTHTGTHVDAPRHLFPQGITVDQLPLEALVGDAWLCRLPRELTMVTADALEKAAVPPGTRRLLLATANGALWDSSPWSFAAQFVALAPDAARWVVGRGIQLLGIDYLSVDPADAPGLPAHQILLSQGVILAEGLDLRQPPEGPYRLLCLPLKIEGADGSPARVLLTREG